jgi:hypothetical protein
MNARKTEEQLTEQLILSAKRREFILATKLLEKIHNMLTSPTGAWFREDQNKWALGTLHWIAIVHHFTPNGF